jgi:hypothetical protein
MLRLVAVLRTDVSEEHSAFFIRVTRICELGTTLAVTSNRRTLRRNTTAVKTSHLKYNLFRDLTKLNDRSVYIRERRTKFSLQYNVVLFYTVY